MTLFYKPAEGDTTGGAGYYWIVSRVGSKTVLLGPKLSEEEANQVGYTQLEGYDFRVIQLPTRDKHKASGMVKAQSLQDGSSVEYAIKPVRHQMPTRRA